jgi:hypothetical protein
MDGEHGSDDVRFVGKGVTNDLNPVSLSDLLSESAIVPAESTEDKTAPHEPS